MEAPKEQQTTVETVAPQTQEEPETPTEVTTTAPVSKEESKPAAKKETSLDQWIKFPEIK